MRDHRNGFCYQELAALDVLFKSFDGKERATALALYQAMTYAANERRAEGGRDGFQMTRLELASIAGSSDRTLDRYAREFEKLGILKVERTEGGKIGGPNTWILLTPMGEAKRTPGRSQPQGVGEAKRTPSSNEEIEEGVNPPTPLQQEEIPVGGSRQVWQTYVEVMKPKRTKLDEDTRRIISNALKVATAEECCTAIRACEASDYHMKRGTHTTRRGQRYNRIGQILKPRPQRGETQRDRIDFWLERAEGPEERDEFGWTAAEKR